MKERSFHTSQHVVHVTSIPCGKWTWALEKYWDGATIDAFLSVNQNWLWQLAQASPFLRRLGAPEAVHRFSWVLRENPSRSQEQESTPAPLLWAQAQRHFGNFVRFRVFVGCFDGHEASLPETSSEQWVGALVSGLFLTSQCDFINVIILDPALEQRLSKIFGSPHQLSVFPKGCEFPLWNSETLSPRIEINEYCLTRSAWLAQESSQAYQKEHRYLRSRFEMVREADLRRHQPRGRKRLSFWKRLLGVGRR
jgi:hypothetical protein